MVLNLQRLGLLRVLVQRHCTQSRLRHLSISNNNAAAKKITAQFYDSSAAVYYFLAQDLSVAANGFVNIVDGNFISLNANDKIILTAETAGTISALISAEEYYDPNR